MRQTPAQGMAQLAVCARVGALLLTWAVVGAHVIVADTAYRGLRRAVRRVRR